MGADPVSIGLMAVQTGMQVFGAVKGAKAEAKGHLYDAAASEENARLAELEGAYDESAIRRQERALSGEAAAAQGGSGIMMGTGSALELLRENAYNSEYDALLARYGAASKAYSYRKDAERSRAAAKSAKKGGLLKAGAAILSGASSAYGASRTASASASVRSANASGLSMPVPTLGR